MERRAVRLGLVVVLTASAAAVAHALAGGITYAKTPASAGAVDPKAILLGDGYVSGWPKVGYVHSCRTSFGGIGGAQAVGPWIDTAARTWDATRPRS